MTIIYNEPYYDSYKKEYTNILSCDTSDEYIISLCQRYSRKPLSTFQNFDDLHHSTCSYAFKSENNRDIFMNINDLPQLLLLLSNLYDINYKMGKLIDKHSTTNDGRKFICILNKK
tara:strand:- start:1285 stop:1632 length:348 start_codon:yes stop_codon:yes gene_type:complete